METKCGRLFCMVRQLGGCTPAEMMEIMAKDPNAIDATDAFVDDVENKKDDCQRPKELEIAIQNARRKN